MNQKQRSRLQVVKMKIPRRIARVRLIDKVPYKKIRRKLDVKKRKTLWFGHLVRMRTKRLAKRTRKWTTTTKIQEGDRDGNGTMK